MTHVKCQSLSIFLILTFCFVTITFTIRLYLLQQVHPLFLMMYVLTIENIGALEGKWQAYKAQRVVERHSALCA